GKTEDQINALKYDPTLAREMAGHYIRENAAALKRNGWPPTAGNQYLAYHFGAGGANRLLRADDKTPGKDILGETVMKANPNLAGMSVGQIREWAAERMNPGLRR
ncbi:MAG: hypothetical protein H7841_18090, partial [Magnetospirillum sp. WYHS-4]